MRKGLASEGTKAETLREERMRADCDVMRTIGSPPNDPRLDARGRSCDDFVGVGGLVCLGDESVDGGPEIDNGSEGSNTSLARAGLTAHGRCEIVLGTINIGTVHGRRQRDPCGWLSCKNHIPGRRFDRGGADRSARGFSWTKTCHEFWTKMDSYPRSLVEWFPS
jgi:hypothetical protein